MRVLLLGAGGQVGRALCATLPALGERVVATRDGRLGDVPADLAADLGDPESLAAALDASGADLVVNAAAYTAVDRAESEPAAAARINAAAVGEIGRWAAARGVPVLHYSTDYVFDGRGSRPLREDDPVGPQSVYGRSKLAGEQALADSGADHLVLRTAWVYAAHGHNFLRTMLRLGAERDRLTVVDDQHGTPTSAGLIAAASTQVLARWLALPADGRRRTSGIYHLVAGGRTTWYGFARAILERAVDAGLLPRAPDLVPIATGQFPTPARRPAWSVLDTSRVRETFGVQLPDWESALDAVIAELAGSRSAP